jgi:hypothetical protein
LDFRKWAITLLEDAFAFQSLISVIFLVKLGKLKEGEKYGLLIEEFRKCEAGVE